MVNNQQQREGSKVLVRELSHVVMFYRVVKETQKTVWLRQLGSLTDRRFDNSEHEWGVIPDFRRESTEVIQKRKRPNGAVKMGEYDFAVPYDPNTIYTERRL